jgi:site-specific DNA-methyltransferase (adenine-specific)
MDFFAGSGTTGEAAAKHGRNFVMIDESEAAIHIMEKRLRKYTSQRQAVAEDAPSSSTPKP